MEAIFLIIRSMLITIFTYMVIPMSILFFIKKDIRKWIKLIVVLNGILVFISIRLICFFVLNIKYVSSGGAALIWSGLNYYILNKHYNKPYNVESGISTDSDIKKQKIIKKTKSIFFIVIIISIILLATIFIINKVKSDNVISANKDAVIGTWDYKENGIVKSSWTFNDDETFSFVFDLEKYSGRYKYVNANDEIILYLEDSVQKVISANKSENLLRIQIDFDSPIIYYEKEYPGD